MDVSSLLAAPAHVAGGAWHVVDAIIYALAATGVVGGLALFATGRMERRRAAARRDRRPPPSATRTATGSDLAGGPPALPDMHE